MQCDECNLYFAYPREKLVMILVECDCCKYSLVTVVDLLKKKDRISSTITAFCLENAVCNDKRTNRS